MFLTKLPLFLVLTRSLLWQKPWPDGKLFQGLSTLLIMTRRTLLQLIIVVTGITGFQRSQCVLVSLLRRNSVLLMAVSTLCDFTFWISVRQVNMRVYWSRLRFNLNIFLYQVIKCRSVTNQTLLFGEVRRVTPSRREHQRRKCRQQTADKFFHVCIKGGLPRLPLLVLCDMFSNDLAHNH